MKLRVRNGTSKAEESKRDQSQAIRRNNLPGLPGPSHFRKTKLKKLDSNGSSNSGSDTENHEPQCPRRSKSLNLKAREKLRLEEIKQRGQRGVNTMKEKSANVLQRTRQHTPSIRLKTPSARPLPSRSLFQHKPRTWYGSKKEKGTKVKEDWRNARPVASGSNKKSQDDIKVAPIRKEKSSKSHTDSPSLELPVRRSRSAPTNWQQYIVSESE